MRCTWCSKKAITLQCKWCNGSFCTRDIQLELHKCPKMENAKIKTLEKLERNMPVVVAAKIHKI